MTDEARDTGEIQEKQPNGRPMAPVDTRFGGKRANRRNNNGRPKSFDQFRKLVQRILAEELPTPDGGSVTRAEALVRVMSSSKAPADRATLLAYGFGKPKDEVDLTTGGDKITFVVERRESDGETGGTLPPPA